MKKGFTLIELLESFDLVVIAIIGILFSIVVASLHSTKEKGDSIKHDCTQYENSRVRNVSKECLEYFANKQ